MIDQAVITFKETVLGPFAGVLEVPVEGYKWVEGLQADVNLGAATGDVGPWLVAPGTWGERPPSMRKSAFAKRNLHRTFASVRPTADRIEKFAAQFGLLTGGVPLFDPAKETQSPLRGESLQTWKREITKMAGLLRLWDHVQADDRDALRPFVVWHDNPRQVILWFAYSRSELLPKAAKAYRMESDPEKRMAIMLTARDNDPDGFVQLTVDRVASDLLGVASSELLDRWPPGDTIEPIRFFIYREVNKVLDGRVKPAVLPYRANDLYFFTDSLLAALYALFTMELTGKVRPAIVCAGCGTYFVPVHGRQAYCEESCRKLAWHHAHKDDRKGKVNGKAR